MIVHKTILPAHQRRVRLVIFALLCRVRRRACRISRRKLHRIPDQRLLLVLSFLSRMARETALTLAPASFRSAHS